MKSLLHLLAFGAIASSLASCSQATYPLGSKTPLSLGAGCAEAKPQIPPAATATASIVRFSHPAPAVALPQPNQAEDTTIAAIVQSSRVLTAAVSIPPAAHAEGPASSRPARTSLVQKVLLKRMAAQLHKVQVARRNVAQIEKGQALSRTGRAAIIALIGAVLVAIVIGSSANSIENATGLILLGIIGYALLVTGIVLLVISLVNGS